MKKEILHIIAGDDTWTPTTQELQDLVDTFQNALKETKPNELPVVATRNGVQVIVIEYGDPQEWYSSVLPTALSNQGNSK